MTATRSKPISPAVAATQTDWHCRQAAEYFAQSTRQHKTPQAREQARRRFLADTKHALPALGIDAFLVAFKQHLLQRDDVRCFDEAEPIITALAAELAIVPRVVPVAVEPVAVPAVLPAAMSPVDICGSLMPITCGRPARRQKAALVYRTQAKQNPKQLRSKMRSSKHPQ